MAPTQSVFMPIATLLAQMFTQTQAAGSAITDFNSGSIARSLYEALAIVVSNGSQIADQLQLDSYLDSATGPALDALAGANWFVTRNAAVQAAGEITITRQATTGALSIPAGWSQLSTVPGVAGTQGVTVVTTEDADFAIGVATATVTAQAVLGGLAGNLSLDTYLIPMGPVVGVSSQNGYQVTTAFTGGLDAESDVAFAARIPLAVQGRVLGRAVSFQAAALGVPGVLSAGVLMAGMERGDSTVVPVGSAEVYYQGSAGLLSAVESAVSNAAAGNQNPSAFASVSLSSPRGQLRAVANVTVYYQPGTDPVALAAAVSVALQAYVNGCGIGDPVYVSQAVQAVLAVAGVASVGLPLTAFHWYGGSGAVDLTVAGDSYANLAAVDVTVTATEI